MRYTTFPQNIFGPWAMVRRRRFREGRAGDDDL